MNEVKRGILFIILGVLFILTVDDDKPWRILDYIKVVSGVVIIVAGAIIIIKYRKDVKK